MSADAVAFFDDDQDPPQPAELARVEIPGDIPRGRGGRPKIRRLLQDGSEDPTTLVEYTRASSLGDVLEDHYAIHLRELRMVAWAVGHDPALRWRSQAVETITEAADKKALRELAETALLVCRASTGADRGTAAHKLSEQFDEQGGVGHVDEDVFAVLARYSELIQGFDIIASETFVVCDELEAAGSFDRIVSPRWAMTAPDGTVIEPGDRLVLDLKTGSDAKFFGPNYAVQQAVYAHGTPYSHGAGRGRWPHRGPRARDRNLAPRRDWSLILHIPIESPEDAGLWWVDLTAGMELARAAAQARVLRRRAGMFLPAEPPAPPPPVAAFGPCEPCGAAAGESCAHTAAPIPPEPISESELADLMAKKAERAERTIIGLIHAARTLDDLGRIWERYGADAWTPACTAAANAQADKLSPAAVTP